MTFHFHFPSDCKINGIGGIGGIAPYLFALCFEFLRSHPAPGFRSLASGGLSYVGNGGFSYSSSVSGSNGVYLDFYVTGLNPSYAYLRAYGLQLRCLSE